MLSSLSHGSSGQIKTPVVGRRTSGSHEERRVNLRYPCLRQRIHPGHCNYRAVRVCHPFNLRRCLEETFWKVLSRHSVYRDKPLSFGSVPRTSQRYCFRPSYISFSTYLRIFRLNRERISSNWRRELSVLFCHPLKKPIRNSN